MYRSGEINIYILFHILKYLFVTYCEIIYVLSVVQMKSKLDLFMIYNFKVNKLREQVLPTLVILPIDILNSFYEISPIIDFVNF